ncbi:hypothetical protein [Streptosporangium lutulentum]|uniref:Transcriptional regulator with XRE-family HTH domain n=1 Tax=Streptosporangium lutulentum TaxID=1461250 RepID=A0ABT9QB60_9ACTN|nr:hypothetical protein [Streptosporangium lutulentum]MDP9843289.1 transcriptional regulator with XRE-family HTH domain [Streptosporangium lutulentum]
MAGKRAVNGVGPVGRVVAANVRLLRRGRGWSQQELSERMAAAGRRLSDVSVTKLEAAADAGALRMRHVDVDDLVVLARVFEVEPVMLLRPLEVRTVVEVAKWVE